METPTQILRPEDLSITVTVSGKTLTLKPQVVSGYLKCELRKVMKEAPVNPRDAWNEKVRNGMLVYKDEIIARGLKDDKEMGLFVAMRLLQDKKVTEEEVFAKPDYEYDYNKEVYTLRLFKTIIDHQLIDEEHRQHFQGEPGGEFYQRLPYLEVEKFTASFLGLSGVRG